MNPMDNAPADGWHLGLHDAHYLYRDCVNLAVVFHRPSGWEYWDFRTAASVGLYVTLEAAKRAAEEATCKPA